MQSSSVSYRGDPSTGHIVANSATSGGKGPTKLVYDSTNQTFEWISLNLTGTREIVTLFDAKITDWVTTYTNSRFWGYVKNDPATDYKGIFRLYKSGASNDELQLSFSGFGHLRAFEPFDPMFNFLDRWVAYGVKSDPSRIPKSGIESYSGVIYGFSIDRDAGRQFDITGSVTMDIDYTGLTNTGNMQAIATTPDGQRIQLSSGTFANAFKTDLPGLSEVRVSFIPDGMSYNNLKFGMTLFGPSAEEIAGTFDGEIRLDATSDPIYAQGIVVMRRN